jgi:hypothetical protein
MTRVTYDGETVEFNGPAPSDMKTLVALMTHAAAGDGRMLLSVKVNGKEILGGKIDMPFGSDNNVSGKTGEGAETKVEILSGTRQQLFLKAMDATLELAAESDAAIDPIVETLLCDSWENAFAKLNSFMQNLAPYFELMHDLTEYAKTNANAAAWKAELEKSVASINESFPKILKFSEKRQVAELTSLLNFEFRPIYENSLALIKGSVRKSFAG